MKKPKAERKILEAVNSAAHFLQYHVDGWKTSSSTTEIINPHNHTFNILSKHVSQPAIPYQISYHSKCVCVWREELTTVYCSKGKWDLCVLHSCLNSHYYILLDLEAHNWKFQHLGDWSNRNRCLVSLGYILSSRPSWISYEGRPLSLFHTHKSERNTDSHVANLSEQQP